MILIKMKILNIGILLTYFVIGITTVCLGKIKGRKRTTQYMVQVNEEWIDVVKQESSRFGFMYKRKLVSNVYLFQESPSSQTNKSRHGSNMEDFKEFFAEKIIRVEKKEWTTVRYYSWRNQTLSKPKTWFEQRLRHKRTVKKRNKCWPYYGMDVQEAWYFGYTGLNVSVAVVDTGIEIDHPDLKRNIDNTLSHSFVDRNYSNVNPLRLPNYFETEDITGHGTMAAGLIAGEFGNQPCSAGIAYNAKLIALKVFKLEEDLSDWRLNGFQFKVDHISEALAYQRDKVDIYSCSFNLHNKFKAATLDMRTALKEGVETGRKGKGSIYVFSAGNRKGPVYDCNMEALANSIYTITISSVGTKGSKPSYAIPCASTLASTYGEFKTYSGSKKLKTTTHDGKCSNFIGTSASTALASGIFALTLQANPELTWRDLQHIIVLSSSFKMLQNTGQLKQNKAGLWYDPFFGFGLVNAKTMVLLAKSWKSVPMQEQRIIKNIHPTGRSVKFEDTLAVILRSDNCKRADTCVRFLEHVMINLNYKTTTTKESLIDIILCSPSKTCSYMLNRRSIQEGIRKRDIQRDWNFTSVHFWGENPEGNWILLFKENPNHSGNLSTEQPLEFLSAELTLFGTSLQPFEKDYNVSVTQPTISVETINFTELYDTFVNKLFEDLPKADVDDVLVFVEETTKKPTSYWVGIIIAVVITACLVATLFSYRKNICEWFINFSR